MSDRLIILHITYNISAANVSYCVLQILKQRKCISRVTYCWNVTDVFKIYKVESGQSYGIQYVIPKGSMIQKVAVDEKWDPQLLFGHAHTNCHLHRQLARIKKTLWKRYPHLAGPDTLTKAKRFTPLSSTRTSFFCWQFVSLSLSCLFVVSVTEGYPCLPLQWTLVISVCLYGLSCHQGPNLSLIIL